MRLRRRLGGWRRVERYRGRGRLADGDRLPRQLVGYRIEVWEQFVGGRGGRYKIEGVLDLESPPVAETAASLILERDIRLAVRVFPDGKVLGESGPEFPASSLDATPSHC